MGASRAVSGYVVDIAVPGLRQAACLGEGDTPLRPAEAMARDFGLGALWIKNEAVNPTGSYKDRLNAVAISAAVEFGFRSVATSSTGNQAVSLAAYAAVAGVHADVFLPTNAPRRAAAEAERMGAHAWVTGWDRRAGALRALVDQHGYGYVGRNCPRPLANPYGMEGYKSIAYEIVRDLGGESPYAVLMPSCGGDGIYGVWRGFREVYDAGIIRALPRMVGCHLVAAPSVTAAWRAGSDQVLPVEVTESIGLSLVDERGGDHALWALHESGGSAVAVTDAELVGAMANYGRLGVFAEPAGAAGLAGIAGFVANEPDSAGKVVVAVMTGGGSRWPAALADMPDGRDADDPVRAVLAAHMLS